MREEYVKNESEYRKFKYLIPALILIHTFFIFQIKNLQEFPSLSSFSSHEALCGHHSRDHLQEHVWVKWGHEESRPPYCQPPPPRHAPQLHLSGTSMTVGTKATSWPQLSPERATEFSGITQPSCGYKVLARVQTLRSEKKYQH